jgi:hypothetical protein
MSPQPSNINRPSVLSLHIERLSIEGLRLASHDTLRFQFALKTELARLIVQAEFTLPIGSNALDTLPIGQLALTPDADRVTSGRRVAASLLGLLGPRLTSSGESPFGPQDSA